MSTDAAPPSRLLVPKEVVKLIPVSIDTLRHWRYLTSAGTPTGPRYFKIGAKPVYDERDVIAYLDQQRQATGTAGAERKRRAALSRSDQGPATSTEQDDIPAPRPSTRAASTPRGRRARGRRS